jgi:ribonucleoside-diphosphate reductase alpha chain
LRDDISKLEINTIPVAFIEKMIEAKLMEYGLTKPSPIHLDKSIFVKNRLNLSENARRVLRRRYLKKSRKGKVIETPEQMFRRVASHIAKAEKKYGDKSSGQVDKWEEIFYEMMTDAKFLPNSPTLMNAGRRLGQLAACFVLPVEDSMEGIFGALHHAALIHKSGGGTGFAFSRLRPKNSTVGTTGGVASGPVSFMKIFNTATEQVKQGGTRRGANMAILRVDHPDIMEFIFSKENNSELNNFNISVGVSDKFMKAVDRQEDYDLIDPRDQSSCGEQPLLPMEASNLGSINLAKFVLENGDGPVIDFEGLKEVVGRSVIDFEGLKEVVGRSVRFLDNTIDMSKYPLAEIDEMVQGNRKIGLGVMGFADMLFQLKIPYNSDEALETAETVMRFIQEKAHEASQNLSEERGVFPNWEQSIYKERDLKLRNATCTTIAPTGTLSIIAGCSSGIEPLFALSFIRNVMDNDKLLEVNPHFAEVANDQRFYSRELMDEIAKRGSIKKIKQIPKDVRKVFVTAHDVSPDWHIRMQAAFQKYIDNAVSKTVNLPRDATVEDVMKVYSLANELGCKGVTIYRDGSKENQVLSFSQKDRRKDKFMSAVKERPETLDGFTTRMKTGYGHLYVTVTEYDGKPFEVFATIGKSGRSTTAKTEAIGRLASLALRSGIKVNEIIDQLKGIGGEHPVFQNGGLVLSIPDAIARVLDRRYISGDAVKGNHKSEYSLLGEKCPECGQTVSFEEGCILCHFCGFNKCG